jgi:outer membrane protein
VKILESKKQAALRGKHAIAVTMATGLLTFATGGAAFAQNTPGAPGTAPGTPQAPTTPAPGVPQTPQAPAPTTPTGITPQTPPRGGTAQPGTENSSPIFDLSRTIGAALNSSSELQIARRNVEISERFAGEQAAHNRPTVDASATATRFDQKTQVAIGGGPPVTVLQDHTEQLTVGVTQRLDFLGQIRAATNQAKLQALADRFQARQIEEGRTLQAKTIYYSLLRAEHQVQVAESTLRSARAQQAIAQKLYEGQIGQKIDFLRANTQVAQAEQDVQRATNDREVARAAFNDLVGRPLDSPVQAVDVPGVTVGTDFAPPAGTPAQPVGAPPATPFTPFAPPLAEVDAIKVDDSISLAQTQRPEVLQGEVLVRVAETGIRLARVGQEPSFTLSASGNYFPTPSLQAPRQRTAGLTAAISIPLYDGGVTREKVSQAKLRTENARTSLGSTKSGVALEVRQAYLNLSTAARQISAANAALEQAIAARQLAQVRYEGQVGLFLEVTDAQAALVRAENNQVDAVYAYLIARAQFENALGTAVTPNPQQP